MQDKTLKLTFKHFIDIFNKFPDMTKFSMEIIQYDGGWEVSACDLELVENTQVDIDDMIDEVSEYLHEAYLLGEIDNYGTNDNSNFFYHLANDIFTPSTITQKAINQVGVDKYNRWFNSSLKA